ncbi:MAK10-like protein [Tanacetum coccineum]
METRFEAQVRDYMVAHTERMERFENAIFKQREEINNRVAEMFGLLKGLTSSQAPKKVLVIEEARHPITKNLNSISLIRVGEEKKWGNNGVVGKNIIEPNNLIVIELLEEVDRDGKMGCETYHSLPIEPMRKAILKKMITKKEDMEGNFVIPCNIGGLKYIDALVDQGSDVNVMPLSTYNRLTKEELLETDIRLFLASQSHIYTLGIAKDVLIEVVGKEMKFDQWRSKVFNKELQAPAKEEFGLEYERGVTPKVNVSLILLECNCSTIDQSRIVAWSNCYSEDNDENLVDDNIRHGALDLGSTSFVTLKSVVWKLKKTVNAMNKRRSNKYQHDEGTKKQQTYQLIIRSIDVNAARYVLVLPMAVNTASLIFEGRLVMPVHVNAAITKVTTVELKPRSKLLIFTSPLLDYDKNGKKMLTGDDYISTSGEDLAL